MASKSNQSRNDKKIKTLDERSSQINEYIYIYIYIKRYIIYSPLKYVIKSIYSQ